MIYLPNKLQVYACKQNWKINWKKKYKYFLDKKTLLMIVNAFSMGKCDDKCSKSIIYTNSSYVKEGKIDNVIFYKVTCIHYSLETCYIK